MRKAVRLVLIAFGGIAALIVVVLIIGMSLPRAHVAVVEARYRASAADIQNAITDVGAGPSWRTGLQEVVVLSGPGEPLRWRETATWGVLTFVQDASGPGRVVNRIADEDQGFGGTWTYEITPAPDGAMLRITENGVVSNPMFRFMARYVFGYYTGLETYVRDLGTRFGESVEPKRVRSAVTAT